MSKPATALVACAVALVALPASPVWSRTDGKICELAQVARDHADSSRCLACHDGSVTSEVHATFAAGGAFEGAGAGGSHPVELSYELAQLKHPRMLAPSATLNPNLVLTEGRVTCATCHDGASPHPFHAAVSMKGSAMCFACHEGY